MSLVIPPGFGNAALVFTSSTGTQPFVTTIGVDLGEFGGDFVSAADLVMLSYASNMAAITDNDLVLDHVTLAVGSDGPGGSVDSSLTPIPMTSSGTFGPVAIAVLARKVTNELGRRGRGRMFLPGTNLESGTEPDGSITSGYRTSIQSGIDGFMDDLVAGTGYVPAEPVLLHSAAPTDPTPITRLAITDIVGVVRGRIR